MKKQSRKIKDKSDLKSKGAEPTKASESANGESRRAGGNLTSVEKPPRSLQKTVKKSADKNAVAVGKFLNKAGQFLREAKLELKKVKWPTRKELLASTAVVIVLTLLLAFFLGLVDFGLIKIIRNVVG